MAAQITMDVGAATANGEHTQLEVSLEVNESGESFVTIYARDTSRQAIERGVAILRFDAYEWERIQRVFGEVNETLKKIEEGGAFFRIG